RRNGRDVEADLRLIRLRLADGDVVHLEGELFTTAQKPAGSGGESDRFGSGDVTGKESIKTHQLAGGTVEDENVMNDLHVAGKDDGGAQPDIVRERADD